MPAYSITKDVVMSARKAPGIRPSPLDTPAPITSVQLRCLLNQFISVHGLADPQLLSPAATPVDYTVSYAAND